MTNATFDIFQQVYVLSCMSNATKEFTGSVADLEAKMRDKLQQFLVEKAQYLGPWSIVWGPAVWQAPFSDVIDNMLVVFGNGTGTYVVATPGTSSVSKFDLLEDMAVMPGPGGDVSFGTWLGVQALLSLQAPIGQGRGDLKSFLASLGGGNTFIFAGHSLGGALVPALALALFPEGSTGGNTVRVYPTAGPTVGTQAFVDRFNAAFPKTPDPSVSAFYACWNVNIRNTLDVVPHVWGHLLRVPDLYAIRSNRFHAGLWVKAGMMQLALDALKANYHELGSATFDGTQTQEINNGTDFGHEMMAQHVGAYSHAFGVTPAMSELPELAPAPIRYLALMSEGLSVALAEHEARTRAG